MNICSEKCPLFNECSNVECGDAMEALNVTRDCYEELKRHTFNLIDTMGMRYGLAPNELNNMKRRVNNIHINYFKEAIDEDDFE